jgi:hypothetical protein
MNEKPGNAFTDFYRANRQIAEGIKTSVLKIDETRQCMITFVENPIDFPDSSNIAAALSKVLACKPYISIPIRLDMVL